MTQNFLQTLNQKLPLPRYKPFLRATAVPILGINTINALCTLATRSPNYVSIYHRYSKFFFPQLTRDAQIARLRQNKTLTVTSILNSTQDPSHFSVQDDEYFLRGLKHDEEEDEVAVLNHSPEHEDQNRNKQFTTNSSGSNTTGDYHSSVDSFTGASTIRSDVFKERDALKEKRKFYLSQTPSAASSRIGTVFDSKNKEYQAEKQQKNSTTNNKDQSKNTNENDDDDDATSTTVLRRDLTSFELLFPFADVVDGCARARTGIGLSPIHGRGLFATCKIPKNSVVVCIRVMDFVDPVGMLMISKSPRSLPTLWRYYSPTGGGAFQVPISANATHFMNHCCDPTLRAGFHYPLDENRISAYRKRLEDLVGVDSIDPEKLNERRTSFERNVDGIFGSDVIFDPSSEKSKEDILNSHNEDSMFINDPTKWLHELSRTGDPDLADTKFEPPLLRSLSDERVQEYRRLGKPFGVDWNSFVATRDIEAGEELTYDYARHLAPSYAREFLRTSSASPCSCQSRYCTGDLYRSIPTKIDLVSSHADRVRMCKPYFGNLQAKLDEEEKMRKRKLTGGEAEKDEEEDLPKIKSMSHMMNDKYDEKYFNKDDNEAVKSMNDEKNREQSNKNDADENNKVKKDKNDSENLPKLSKEEEEYRLALGAHYRDPHDDDLVRASFIRNKTEFIEKMHRTLPRTLMYRGPVVSNTNKSCEYLTSMMAKEKLEMPAGTTMGELH